MAVGRTKITVVGAGFIGGTLVQRLAERDYADIVLIDILEDLAKGKALDIMQAGPVVEYETKIEAGLVYEKSKGSEIVVITSGVPRKPGMTREELIEINTKIVAEVSSNIKESCPDAILVNVTNPLDAMTYVAWKVTGFPKQRVMGMAGILDTTRFRTFIAQELGVSVRDVYATVLGTHGESMVPSPTYTTVAGVPIRKLLPEDKIKALVQRTVKAGAEIVSLLKAGSAYYAPTAAVVEMLDSIIHDQKRILPCSVLLEGQYGISGVFCGVPIKIGREGVEQIIELDLPDDELSALKKAAESLEKLQGQAEEYLKGR